MTTDNSENKERERTKRNWSNCSKNTKQNSWLEARHVHPFAHSLHRSEKGTKEQIENSQDEERQHTQACIKAYKRQLSMGRHFLHEHPVHQRWEDTFGARSDVSLAHGRDRRSK